MIRQTIIFQVARIASHLRENSGITFIRIAFNRIMGVRDLFYTLTTTNFEILRKYIFTIFRE